ncbi:MAG TPA: hypothetical protein VI731_05765 [Bacteroidia bacterium]|nr:hypothetical protein [Bacteroidia bacterium]
MNPDEPKTGTPPSKEKVPNPGFYIGLITAAALIAYFLIMRALGLAHHVNLRLFNYVIIIAGITWSIKKHVNLEGRHYDYLATLGNGCLTAITAVIFFGAFLFIWLSFDTTLLLALRENTFFGEYLTPLTAATVAAGEDGAFGMIMAYVIMFYINNKQMQTTKE